MKRAMEGEGQERWKEARNEEEKVAEIKIKERLKSQ